jgi:hypothetical protein
MVFLHVAKPRACIGREECATVTIARPKITMQSFLFLMAVIYSLPASAGAHPCQICHPKEVESYSHYGMAHSLTRVLQGPSGSFQNKFGIRFTTYSDESGTWQRMENAGEISTYRVEYIIGSGKHAFGFLVRIGEDLFQSPIGYYTDRHAYGMAPGYERGADVDFTRPVTEECLFCHSGKPLHIAGTVAGYEAPAFAQEAISCERCHGPSEEHLRKPVPGSIVNPAKLSGAARDSICEQCHLSGVIRIPNPGKKVEDFRAGMRLEDAFSVYVSAAPSSAFRVISQSEQLHASACTRNSGGKLWCGTCHDLHNEPADPVAYYRGRCLSCHAGKLGRTHPAANSNCISCHMPRRPTSDGAHTVFTDHWIRRRPAAEFAPSDTAASSEPELVAWREPDAEFAARNLALAYINAGLEHGSAAWIVKGYRILTEVQAAFPRDAAVFKAFGLALLRADQPQQAKIAFDRALQLEPADAMNEENAGRADLACGNIEQATKHLEKAMQLDPLLLSSVALLERIYHEQGESTKGAALAERVRLAMGITSGAQRIH